jgi:hypothetical protein
MRRIEPAELALRPFHILDEEWALPGRRPRATQSDDGFVGGLGTLWNRPVATVYVRLTRFTFALLNAHRNSRSASCRPEGPPTSTRRGSSILDQSLYPQQDYHRAFIGEVVAAWVTA